MTIFPEGQTSKSGQLLPFRNGAFKIAQRAKRPVVVSVLENSRAIYHNLFRRRTRVRVRILGVVPTEDVATLRTVQIGDRAHAMIAAALQADGALRAMPFLNIAAKNCKLFGKKLAVFPIISCFLKPPVDKMIFWRYSNL